ncbi:MAG: DUF4416 family protein [Endomicrobiia bacterium]
MLDIFNILMGKIKLPQKVKLICGILLSEKWVLEKFDKTDITHAISLLNNQIVTELNSNNLQLQLSVDLQSSIINFNFTDYYKNELVENVLRYWISFLPNISLENLWKIKIVTNNIETNFFSDEKHLRKVNVDPGYVESSKLVLFTTKNYSHRIYLAEGIYAENTLIYSNKKFEPLPWTYPDYKIPESINFFSTIRKKLICENKNE